MLPHDAMSCVDTGGAGRSSCAALVHANRRGSVMTDADLARTVDAAWETRDSLGPATRGAYRDAVEEALEALDTGRMRVAEKTASGWRVNQWLKKAVLLSFR